MSFANAEAAYLDPPDAGYLDTEECPWCFRPYDYDGDYTPRLHPICERKIAARTCCGIVWVDGGPCERCGRKLVNA